MLASTATTSERVQALLAIGLRSADIARCSGVSQSALRNWSSGSAQPRPDAAIVLDDLRTVAKVLLDGGIATDRAVSWLTSRDPDRFHDCRPLDLIRSEPMSVLAAAHGAVLDGDHRPADQGAPRTLRPLRANSSNGSQPVSDS
jgi:transcriptional regulator with XRE-family HTH domain